jgi:hypothetical protein
VGSTPATWAWPRCPSTTVGRAGRAASTRRRRHRPAPTWGGSWPAGAGGRAGFLSALGRIGTGAPRRGPLPGYPQPAEGQTHRVVADPWRGEPLGQTARGGQCQRPPTRRLAERPWTLGPEGPEGRAGPSLEDARQGGRSRRWRRQRGEAAWLTGMHGVAHGLVGAVQLAGTGGGGRPRGPGEEERATAYGTGGRRAETGLQGGPLVRRERAHTSGCVPTQQ